MMLTYRLAVLAAALFLAPAAALAQSRLPVEEGVYAEAGASCASGWVWVYTGRRAGYLSFYGPNQSMGPDLIGVEPIVSVEPGRDGFTLYNDGGLQVRPAGGGQIIAGAYSRVEGDVGSTRFRRCPVSSLHPRMRAAVTQLGYSEDAVPGSRVSEQRPVAAAAAWRVSRGPAALATARVASLSGLPELAVRCRGDVPYLHLRTSAAARGLGPRSIEFVGSTTGLRRAETFQRDPETGDWSTGAGGETVALLGGRDTQVEMWEDGRTIGTLSLIGSTGALGQALASCPTQGLTSGLAAVPVAGAGTAPPLDILVGHYVTEERSCGNPFDMFYFDGRRFGYYVLGDGREEVSPIVSARQGPDGWALRGASRGPETQVRVLSPNRIQLISGPPMRWCPQDQLPGNRRVSG